MTYRQTATLACKVLAIWALVSALGLLSQSIQSFGELYRLFAMNSRAIDAQMILWRMGALLPLLLQVIIGIWLWRRAGIVAAWIAGSDLHDEPSEPEDAPKKATMGQVQAVVLSSLGIWALLDVLPQIGSTAFQFLLAWIIAHGRFDAGAHVVANNIFVWSIQMLLGLWLIFGASGITRLLMRARGEAIEPPQPD